MLSMLFTTKAYYNFYAFYKYGIDDCLSIPKENRKGSIFCVESKIYSLIASDFNYSLISGRMVEDQTNNGNPNFHFWQFQS